MNKEKLENTVARSLKLAQSLRRMEQADYSRAVLHAAADMLERLASIISAKQTK